MICDECNEKIQYEVTMVRIGRLDLCFCDDDCRNTFINECTSVEVIEDDQE